jgi:hypothetical protein
MMGEALGDSEKEKEGRSSEEKPLAPGLPRTTELRLRGIFLRRSASAGVTGLTAFARGGTCGEEVVITEEGEEGEGE